MRIGQILLGLVMGLLIYHYFIMDFLIDKRAGDLAMMQFSAQQDKMVAKDEHKWTLKYLKDGRMD